MNGKVYDTRFFIEYFYTSDGDSLLRMKGLLRGTRLRYISSVTIHEVYNITLKREGRDVAQLRAEVLKRDFTVINVDPELAILSAEIRHKYGIPMADSVIAATAQKLNTPVITDDRHFKTIREIKVEWL